MKQLLKKLFNYLPFAITKNQKYDAQTRKVISLVCKPDSNCVDVGCHKGEIMDLILRYAPEGTHYGFEPIPELFEKLRQKYKGTRVVISDVALSNITGSTSFNYVISNPSYSGILKRDYDRPNEEDTTITVKTEMLDNLLPGNEKIDLIKIDVEGAEMLVLEGAKQVIGRHRPIIIFEHGLGASDIYGTMPKQVYTFFTEFGYRISLLETWLADKRYFSQKELEEQFHKKLNHYFIAWPA